MRIITGLLKGQQINMPAHLEMRPTTDRVKEGLFSVIEARRFIQNCTVLDLFAGSGNLGFEALSRGAANVLFIDHDSYHIAHIEKTARTFKMSNQIRTATLDVQHFLQGPAAPYDLIFADPPYVYRNVESTVERILDHHWLHDEGWLIFEHNKYHDFQDHSHFLFQKKYGRTFLSFFQGTSTDPTQ